ncbi:hypothetical protein GQ42DRAFT_159822 [Ramicandelaber brevisporus]|nr:hypothetical protein GQ42DRAFT_159822 [Ramicandelaber brevisporus]
MDSSPVAASTTASAVTTATVTAAATSASAATSVSATVVTTSAPAGSSTASTATGQNNTSNTSNSNNSSTVQPQSKPKMLSRMKSLFARVGLGSHSSQQTQQPAARPQLPPLPPLPPSTGIKPSPEPAVSVETPAADSDQVAPVEEVPCRRASTCIVTSNTNSETTAAAAAVAAATDAYSRRSSVAAGPVTVESGQLFESYTVGYAPPSIVNPNGSLQRRNTLTMDEILDKVVPRCAASSAALMTPTTATANNTAFNPCDVSFRPSMCRSSNDSTNPKVGNESRPSLHSRRRAFTGVLTGLSSHWMSSLSSSHSSADSNSSRLFFATPRSSVSKNPSQSKRPSVDSTASTISTVSFSSRSSIDSRMPGFHQHNHNHQNQYNNPNMCVGNNSFDYGNGGSSGIHMLPMHQRSLSGQSYSSQLSAATCVALGPCSAPIAGNPMLPHPPASISPSPSPFTLEFKKLAAHDFGGDFHLQRLSISGFNSSAPGANSGYYSATTPATPRYATTSFECSAGNNLGEGIENRRPSTASTICHVYSSSGDEQCLKSCNMADQGSAISNARLSLDRLLQSDTSVTLKFTLAPPSSVALRS